MAVTEANDTVKYLDAAGTPQQAVGVVILGGSGGGNTPEDLSSYKLAQSISGTNAAVVSSSPAKLMYITCINTTDNTTRYLKIYNKPATPVVGTDVPAMTLPLMPGEAFTMNLLPSGMDFPNGIGFSLAADPADNSTAGVSSIDIAALNIVYAA